jgi:hypothetical protein
VISVVVCIFCSITLKNIFNIRKVGLSYGGDAMTLARWPNTLSNANGSDTWMWARGSNPGPEQNYFYVNATEAGGRMLQWEKEAGPYLHGYWSWDWCDSYGPLTSVASARDDPSLLRLDYANAPPAKPGARWMAVNLLAELDVAKEYYIDAEAQKVYFILKLEESEAN